MAELPAYIQENVPLAKSTTFGIGGPARWLARPGTAGDLLETLEVAAALHAGILVLGGGSNLLVADGGVDAMVIKLSDSGEFSGMHSVSGDPLVWHVGAAVALQGLVGATSREGVAGLQALAGIPGNVGGAVTMNAGGADFGIGNYVAEAEAFDFSGHRLRLDRSDLAFGYRESGVRGVVATGFLFRFERLEAPESLLRQLREHREKKKSGQPLGSPSAGCVFRNPPGKSAGALLDMAGCKGMAEGGAVVSGLHANFILNQGAATCRDVARLAVRMREAVMAAFGIALEPEVKLWGDDPVFSTLRKREAIHVDN